MTFFLGGGHLSSPVKYPAWDNGEKLSLAEFNKLHGHEYGALSQEEKKQYILTLKSTWEDCILKEHAAIWKTSSTASADIHTSVNSVVTSSFCLPEQTGYAMLTLGARMDFGLRTEPIDIVPPILEGFCEEILGKTPLRVAQEMEAWAL